MEISSAFFGNRVHPVIFSFPSPMKSFPPTEDSQSHSATITSTTSTHGPKIVSTSSTPKHKSIPYSAAQVAMLDIPKSRDLSSALDRSGAMLRVGDLNGIMCQLGKLNRLQDLSQLFEWMQQNGKINFASYSSYMKIMGKSLNPLKALDIYNSIKDESTRMNVSICNSVLSCLIKSGKFESSIKLFHNMKQEGLIPDIITYSTLLAGCAKAKDGYSKALELVEELKSKGLQMDSVIYGTILNVCASNNQCKEAENYFIQMKNEGHSPNVFHFSSLLNAYSIDGDYKKAEEILEEMKSAGLVPNKVLLTTLLKVYVRGGLFEKSRELLNELEASGYAREEMPYCLLMDGLAKAGRINEAKLVFDEVKEKHVKSDGYSYSIMIQAFKRHGRLEEAMQLVSDFEGKFEKFDVVMLNTVLCTYCKVGEMENVMKTMRKMDELSINPDRNTFCIMIKYFLKEKLYMLAYQTLLDMHKKGHLLDEELCSSLIYTLGGTGAHSEALSVYNMLRYNKRAVRKSLHEKILHILIAGGLLKEAYVVVKDNARLISRAAIRKLASAFIRLGNINLINDVIKAVNGSGYKLDQRLFCMAVTRYIDQPEKKELLLQLLEWMPGQGYLVDPSTRNLILKNSHLSGRQRTAEILSKQHLVSNASRSH